MIIELDNQYRVKVDSNNFILQQSHQTEGGAVAWTNKGYYTGLSATLEALPDHLARLPEVETLNDYMGRWRRMTAKLGERFGK